MIRTEKEGFEPSRRVTDLHPFQGCPFSLLGTSPNVSLRYDTFAPVIFHIQLLGKQKRAKSGERRKRKRKHNIRKNSVKRRCESRKTADK